MTLYKYLMLSDEKQWDVICEDGVEIGQTTDLEYEYILFAIDRFFIEISFFKSSGQLIEKNAFLEGERMEKYVGEINM